MNKISWISASVLLMPALVGCDLIGGDAARLTEGCIKSTSLGEEICRCVANKAKEELSPNGMKLLIAGLENDEESAAEVRGELTVDQAIAAGAFMTRAPLQCAK